MANEQRMRPRKRKKVCAFCVDKVTAIDYLSSGFRVLLGKSRKSYRFCTG